MDVMAKPTFSIVVSAYGNDLPTTTEKASSSSTSSGETVNEEGGGLSRPGSGIWSGQTVDYSSDSSSLGTPGDSEDDAEESEEENENDDVSSKELGLQGLASMSSLEDSLPNKRGLSNHYKGKSKSFGNLGEIGSVKEVAKQENPLNKRRRLQICNKLARRSFYSWQNPKSMPLLPVNEDEDDDDEEDEDEDLKSGFDENKSSSDEEGGGERVKSVARKPSFKNRAFQSRSCFALSDLIEEEDDDQ
ncbi:Protein OXIDATIVE STRESS 3 LIKE 4 [Cardamine amara subsp. amara]|uniref:Protein OXIDATIVE STRESS 3 LIKE 4 n=1 Tax=Cardamine amara subsp. amara TaxID=228776 RepID=A0ABD1BEJ8_CARAN